jgi:AcrR family transcriptional regulator
MMHDKRAIRSRQLLRRAFLELLREKRYEEISVQEIIERAGVARSTFYAHYVDKEDLLVGSRGVFARDGKPHTESKKPDEKRIRLFLSVCFWRNILSHRETFKIVAKDSAMDVIMRDLHKKLTAIIKANIEQDRVDSGAIPSSLAADHLAGSIITLVKWWVKEDMAYPPEQMNEIFHQMAMSVIPSNQLSHS